METKVLASVCVCVCAALVRPSNALAAALPHNVGAATASTYLYLSFHVFPFSSLSRFFLVVQLLKLLNAHLQPLKGVFVCVLLLFFLLFYCFLMTIAIKSHRV